MRKMKRVLAVMSVIVMLAALTIPTAAASKTLGQCSSCKQGCMMYVGRIPVSEMAAYVEFRNEVHGNRIVRVAYPYHYENDLYRCSHCKQEKKIRVKVYG